MLPFWLSVGTLSVAIRDSKTMKKQKRIKIFGLSPNWVDTETIKKSEVEGNIDEYEG